MLKSTNKSNIKLWTDALRSGRFIQGKGCLSDGARHCCLGVGCEVYNEAYGTYPKLIKFHETQVRAIKYDNDFDELPEIVMDWLGLDIIERSCNPFTGIEARPELGKSYSWTLAELNDDDGDDEGLNFDQIADVIEYCFT